MENILTITQLIAAVLLVITVLMQQRGTGLGGAFGGGGAEVYSAKRGAEKVVFNTTIVLAVIFVGVGIVRLVI